MGRTRCSRNQLGFTLVELVVVIVLVGILGALGGMFIVQPIVAYMDMSRRAELVDAAEMALRRMQRDVRGALPNSIRVSQSGVVWYLEFIPILDAGRYRAQGSASEDILDFTVIDSSFGVIGSVTAPLAAGRELVVYNLAATGTLANAYFGDNRAAIDVGASTATSVVFNPKKFPFASPYQRFFIVAQPVTYVCDPGAGTLTRYANYGFQNSQPPSVAGTGDLVTRRISGCNFTYTAGTSQRGGLVTLQLSVASQGETISLLHQVHVGNAP